MVKLEKVISDRKKPYPERLRGVFKVCGYDNYTPVETGVALLIDDIIQEIREEKLGEKDSRGFLTYKENA